MKLERSTKGPLEVSGHELKVRLVSMVLSFFQSCSAAGAGLE